MQSATVVKRETAALNEQSMDGGHDSADQSKVDDTVCNSDEVTKEEKHLWRQCNKLLKSDKKLTKLYITSIAFHLAVLVFVTVSTITLAKEKSHFQEFWNDMQKGYFSLLVKDYSNVVEHRLKYIYSSQVKILTKQEEVFSHLEYAFQRFERVENISLADVSKTVDQNGSVINPVLCKAKLMPAILHEKNQLYTECKTISSEMDIHSILSSEINYTSLISMQFQFTHLYLIEGFNPICLQVTTHYNINNDLQHYLWPLRVTAKAKLMLCDKPFKKITFLPIKNLKAFILTGSLNMLVCVSGCMFHFVRLIMFCALGKKVRDYAIKKNYSKPLWTYLPLKIQTCIWWTSADREQIKKYAEVNELFSFRAYVIFYPVMHSLDIIFLLLSICGVILEFILLRKATTTDEFIHYSTITSLVLGTSSLYFWCTSFRLFSYSKLAEVMTKSVINSRTAKDILTALIIAMFAYIGISLLAWVLLGLFHPYYTSFRLSAETFWAVLFGDEILDICDYILPEDYDSTQHFVFLMSRVILAIYGILFTFLILSVIIAVVSKDVGDKCPWKKEENNSKIDGDNAIKEEEKLNWKVILNWATASEATHFPGPTFPIVNTNTELANKNSTFHKSESLANRKSKQKAQAKTDKIEKSPPAKINKSTALQICDSKSTSL